VNCPVEPDERGERATVWLANGPFVRFDGIIHGWSGAVGTGASAAREGFGSAGAAHKWEKVGLAEYHKVEGIARHGNKRPEQLLGRIVVKRPMPTKGTASIYAPTPATEARSWCAAIVF
jgi:hypothetical protein